MLLILPMFGRPSPKDDARAERYRAFVVARSAYALPSVLLGAMAVLDFFTIVIGLALGVAAVVVAWLGLRDLKSKPHLLGRRMCLTGLGLGVAGCVLSIVVGVLLYGGR